MSAQQLAQIACVQGDTICTGTFPPNMVEVQMLAPPPAPLPMTSVMTYTWMVEHPNGTWMWHGNVPTRTIPIPFPGKYTVQLLVKYVRRNRNNAHAAYLSNKITINGVVCP